MVDLAGHERYFKTTAYGLTGHLPDFACLIVGANAGDPLVPPRVTSEPAERVKRGYKHVPNHVTAVLADGGHAVAGVVGMCKEHLGVALALKVPVFFVITKVRMNGLWLLASAFVSFRMWTRIPCCMTAASTGSDEPILMHGGCRSTSARSTCSSTR